MRTHTNQVVNVEVLETRAFPSGRVGGANAPSALSHRLHPPATPTSCPEEPAGPGSH